MAGVGLLTLEPPHLSQLSLVYLDLRFAVDPAALCSLRETVRFTIWQDDQTKLAGLLGRGEGLELLQLPSGGVMAQVTR
jgi:hypothetical protein